MAAAAGGRTSSGAFAGRPRPPARHFQFCLPLRPRPRRAPRRPGPLARRARPDPGIRPPSGRPAPWASRTRFVCRLTCRSGSAEVAGSPGGARARGREGRSQEVRTRRGAPGGAPACALLGCPTPAPGRAASPRGDPHRQPGVEDVRGQGSRRPDYGRADTREPAEMPLASRAPRESGHARRLCPGFVSAVVSHPDFLGIPGPDALCRPSF